MFGFVFFIVMYLIGQALSDRLALPLPGSLVGLGLAFAVIAVRGRVDAPLREAASTLLRHMGLMLVPVGAGIVVLIDVVPPRMGSLLLALAISLGLGVVALAKLTPWLLARQRPRARTPLPQPTRLERGEEA